MISQLVRDIENNAINNGLFVVGKPPNKYYDETDTIIENIKCKVIRHKLCKRVKVHPKVDANIIKSDDKKYIVIPLVDFYGMLKEMKKHKNGKQKN